ncbi:hypothetical protein [Winogradskyella thalassocola]|uniref:Uncharacterized protein n=1 Tax=Winogradskyella thalassocola TaxID=262004 RepID=A0A1G8D0W3_9FLAO|nr:hypothetical protein [Winogradskyella thalassocola]SDH51395.1 hypothetical protein SAMN04489796_10396 [Winogradskyella thalassocola]
MKLLKLLPIAICFLCFGCENIIECIINRRPEIPNKSFDVGFVNSYYYEDFTSEIKNEPNDDDYGYTYEIYDDLPEGLQMFANFRTLSIEGTPRTSGTYTFKVYLYVDPPEYYDEDSGQYEDSLCEHSTSKTFTIIIN